MKSKAAIAITLSLSLLGVIQPVGSATAAPTVCKKAGISPVNTSAQTLFSGDTLVVTFNGVGGGCGSGNFKVITSNSTDVNTQGYLSGSVSNVSLNTVPSGSDTNYQAVTHTRQFLDSDKGKFFQYYFVTKAGVKVRSSIVAVTENN
jgi:hypothetical protein